MFNRHTLTATAAALIFALSCQAGTDFNGLKAEMLQVAAKTAATLKEEGQNRVAIRDFTAPASLQANFGLALKDELQTALKSKDIEVDALAKYEIGGEYRVTKDMTDAKSELFGLLLVFEIKEQESGKKMASFSQQVFDNSLMSSVAGVNGSIKQNGTIEERNAEIHNKIKEPEFKVENSIARVEPFGLEIGVMKGDAFEARPLNIRNKTPYVELNQGERYVIRLYNNAPFDVAVVLNIDGINTFRFSELKNEKGEPSYSTWIIPAQLPQKFVQIPGWHKDLKQVYDFVVTDVLNSAAGQLKVTGSIGVINAQFHAILKGGQHNCTDEGATRSAEAATEKARPATQAPKRWKYNWGAMRTSITIRYGK